MKTIKKIRKTTDGIAITDVYLLKEEVVELIGERISKLKSEHAKVHPKGYATCEKCSYYEGRIEELEELKLRINGWWKQKNKYNKDVKNH